MNTYLAFRRLLSSSLFICIIYWEWYDETRRSSTANRRSLSPPANVAVNLTFEFITLESLPQRF